MPRTITSRAVRSYRTLSPLPVLASEPSAVYSLLHWSWAHAPQTLSGTLLCGARTFLPLVILPKDINEAAVTLANSGGGLYKTPAAVTSEISICAVAWSKKAHLYAQPKAICFTQKPNLSPTLITLGFLNPIYTRHSF